MFLFDWDDLLFWLPWEEALSWKTLMLIGAIAFVGFAFTFPMGGPMMLAMLAIAAVLLISWLVALLA
mgnify:CR=1 FL=1